MTSPFVELTARAPKRIGILLGAGASRPLNLPVMADLFPPDFRETIVGAEAVSIFDMAVNWAMTLRPSELDFELVYTAADALASVQPDDLASLPFAKHQQNRGFVFQSGPNLIVDVDWVRRASSALLEQLKTLIHDRVGVVDAERAASLYVPLLKQLFNFAEGVKEIHCFTTNYDRALESIWENGLQSRLKMNPGLIRGFRQLDPNRGLEFDSSTYDTPVAGLVIKLYKLHGGLNWIRQGSRILESPTNDYLQRNALIYPLRKHTFEEPFLTLFQIFNRVLTDLDLLVVIGSSLRDQHLRESLESAMRANSRFKVIVMDPQAASLVASFAGEFEESLFSAPVAFGTPEGERELGERLLEAATYGAV